MERDHDYLYHCNGCDKADKNYPIKFDDYEYGQEIMNTPESIEYHMWARSDAYGIYTGLYCHKCYEDKEKYTYRKDRYFDEGYAGERMDEDY